MDLFCLHVKSALGGSAGTWGWKDRVKSRDVGGMGGSTTNAFSGILSIFTSAPWLGPSLCASSNTMRAQSHADYLCLLGDRLRMWLSSHSAVNTVVDRAGVTEEGKLDC